MENYSLPLKKHTLLFIGFCIVLLSSLGKDLYDAYINNYSYYLSESALFNVFWVLFLPFLLIQAHYVKIKGKFSLIKFPLSVFLIYLFHLIVFATVVYLCSKMFMRHPYSFAKTINYSILESFVPGIIIYGLNGWLFAPKLSNSKNSNHINEIQAKKYISSIPVTSRKKTVLLPTHEILYVISETPYVSISTTSQRFLYSSTLKSFLEKTDPNTFIRVHKTSIVNLDHVKSYQSRKNGDYDIEMDNGQIIRLSRNYRDRFLGKFKKLTG